jgi:hypothetical protein
MIRRGFAPRNVLVFGSDFAVEGIEGVEGAEGGSPAAARRKDMLAG